MNKETDHEKDFWDWIPEWLSGPIGVVLIMVFALLLPIALAVGIVWHFLPEKIKKRIYERSRSRILWISVAILIAIGIDQYSVLELFWFVSFLASAFLTILGWFLLPIGLLTFFLDSLRGRHPRHRD